jgi:hypothetical protein
MDTPDGDRQLVVLSRAECLTLLGSVLLGRIAFTEGALPAVQPVSFALGDGELFIPTHQGSKVAVASRKAVVAFEVDDFDARSRTGWNVTVVGASRVVSDPAEVDRLDALGVRPWTPGGSRCYIGIRTQVVRGRRITRRPCAPARGRSSAADRPARTAAPG